MANGEAVAADAGGGETAEPEAPSSGLAAPARVVAISDLGGALLACEDPSEPGGWSACITRELRARGYEVEAERPEGKPVDVGPEPEARSAPAAE